MKVLIAVLISVTSISTIIIGCSRSAMRDQATPHGQFDNAMDLYNRKKYFKAQVEFQRIIYSFPGQSFSDTALYYLGMSLYGMKSYSEATSEFEKMLNAYSSSPLADKAQYQLAMCHYNDSPGYALDQAETFEAIDQFSTLLSKYPMSPLVPDARDKLDKLNDKLAKKLYKAGEIYLKLDDYNPALLYFYNVRDNYPNTEWAQYSFFYSGVAQMKLGKNTEALETFQNFITAFPNNKLVSKAHKYIARIKPQEAGG